MHHAASAGLEGRREIPRGAMYVGNAAVVFARSLRAAGDP